MTKKEIAELEKTLVALTGGIDYLNKDHVFFCTDQLPTLKSYYNKEGHGLTPMMKFIGSDMAFLLNAQTMLRRIIASEKLKKVELPKN